MLGQPSPFLRSVSAALAEAGFRPGPAPLTWRNDDRGVTASLLPNAVKLAFDAGGTALLASRKRLPDAIAQDVSAQIAARFQAS